MPTFFDDYLEPLFYDALNVNRGEQGYDPALHCRIPFLSGGLFEPIDGYDWKHNDFDIPNEIFSNKANIKYEIIESFGILSTTQSGWTKELNLISWNGGEPKYDIRQWAPEHAKMGKGVSLSREEAEELKKLLVKWLPK